MYPFTVFVVMVQFATFVAIVNKQPTRNKNWNVHMFLILQQSDFRESVNVICFVFVPGNSVHQTFNLYMILFNRQIQWYFGDFEVDLEMLSKCCENVTMRRKGYQKVKQKDDSSTWRKAKKQTKTSWHKSNKNKKN